MTEVKITILKGEPAPLGASRFNGGVNFALFSEHATEVTLCLFLPGETTPFKEITLDPKTHKSDKKWHILVKGAPADFDYGYRINGPNEPDKGLLFNKDLILSDPCSLELTTSHVWGEGVPAGSPPPRSRLVLDSHFNWEGVPNPNLRVQDLVIYEMHVRGFTYHPSSKTHHRGSYLALIEKIPFLKELGVNCVELLPIHEFNECENQNIDPLTKKRLFNYWGYSTINFFAPMNRFASKGERHSAITEFKTMVRELHRHKIEVILDVVYNHTAEGSEKGPTFSFRGVDNPDYYMISGGHYQNFTGCGNTFNCNHPACIEHVLNSLRYWVKEMHVDGFRFDLASILTRDLTGAPVENPPIIQAINKDPILSKTKLIAEAWDAAGLYQVGSFPGEGRWGEWNGVFRDIVRRFIKGSDGCAGGFATALSGSQNLYGRDRSPYHSVNFVTAHDGFSLKDLVSYNTKHNEANGEENRDGMDNNESWNCGAEGETSDHSIIALRERQMRNFHVALMISLGTPMILMGDEYAHTRHGNNNTWCHDDELNWFLWDKIKEHNAFFRFYKLLIHFRTRHPLLRRTEFLTTEEVEWHGHEPSKPNWDPSSRFVAYTLKSPHDQLYIAFNAHYQHAHITLPQPPPHKKWYRVVDTSAPSPDDFIENPGMHAPLKHTYDLPPNSSLILESL
ncbi:MAG: glycogen debranching protein GlgX [Chlamydiales bacterium]|nr:glycogen debranching protein GlgX [Chlamydiales bacterium]